MAGRRQERIPLRPPYLLACSGRLSSAKIEFVLTYFQPRPARMELHKCGTSSRRARDTAHPVARSDIRRVLRPLLTMLAVAIGWRGPSSSPARAMPGCVETCRQETARCARTRCTTLHGQARHACLETCRGIGGCTRIRTFAYVVSTCTTHAFHQQLMIRHGNCDPVRVLDFPEPLDVSPPCTIIGQGRVGIVSSPIVGAFHRMGVSPDGRQVVFEVTDDFSVIAANKLVAPGQEEGIFVVRDDGSGLRRLGPASRDPSFRFMPDPSAPSGGFRTSGGTQFSFSPDGRAVVFTDLGPGPGADDAVQIFTLDIATGSRRQLTHLPAVPDRAVGTIGLFAGTSVPFFLPDGRIAFQSFGNLDGTNSEGNLVEFVMNRDGSDLRSVAPPVAVRCGRLVPIFGVTGAGVRRRADALSVPGTPVNPDAATTGDAISEVFFIDGRQVLQLTHFGRVDTMTPNLTPDGHHVIFVASADPFRANPSGTCQLFSIGTAGSGLRQLTHFVQPEYSTTGCNTLEPPGCQVLLTGNLDPATGTLPFYSSCDPFGANRYGDQLFAIRADGTGLRQLTHARGLVTEPDGSASSENIGPVGISFAGPPFGSPPQ